MTHPFVHLHLHSEYSFLDGACSVKKTVQRAKELGMSALAITDHGNMHSTIEFYEECRKAGIKGIIGMEGYISSTTRFDRDNKREFTYHIVLLAENETGYHNLIKLATLGHLEGFYNNARIDRELLEKYHEGIIVLSACLGGEIPKAISNNDLKSAKEIALYYKNLLGPDHFYLELQDHNTPTRQFYPEQIRVNKELIKLSKELDIPLVVTNDTHFLNKGDYGAHEILCAVGRPNKTLEELRNSEFVYSTEQYFKTQEEMYETFPHNREALENTQKIADMCNVTIEIGKPKLPQYDVPEGETWDSYLEKICKARLPELYPAGSENEEIAKERLQYELDIISKRKLSAYFLIVRDFLTWAKEHDIYYGIRGSGAGSIVSYLSGICAIDPLEYSLWFERFLDLEREGLPDIDCDLEDSRRSEVLDYIVGKYGADKVAQVATFGTLKAKLAIKDVARVLGFNLGMVDKLSKMIGNSPTLEKALANNTELNDLYETDQDIKKLFDIATKLEGLTRHIGLHACAVVISHDDLINVAPLQRATDKKGGTQTQWEYKMAELAGLVKMDLLGLKTFTVIKTSVNFIKEIHGIDLDIQNIPLDDKATFDMLSRGDTGGVFQLESVGMRDTVIQVKPDRLTDIIALVALYRPGPMKEIPTFCKGKHDASSIKYIHPSLEPILKETYGVLVYQEQVMAIGKQIAGLDMVNSNNLLTALRKKVISKMAELEPIFKQGVKDTSGFNDAQANELWNKLKSFAEYAFNKAHSTCYARVGYQTAYLKANYPAEYMAALMSSVADRQEKIMMYVTECRRKGIEVLPPDINYSLKDFSIENGAIRLGIHAIKRVAGAVHTIIEDRESNGKYEDIYDFCTRITSQQCSKTAIDAIIKSGATASLPGNIQEQVSALDSAVDYGRRIRKEKESGQMSIFGDDDSEFKSTKPALIPFEEFSQEDLMLFEKEFLGIYLSNHPLYQHDDVLNQNRTCIIEELGDCPAEKEVVVGGMVTSLKYVITQSQKKMAFITLDDLSGEVEVVIFAATLEKCGDYIKNDGIILVKAKVDKNEKDSFKQNNTFPSEDEEENVVPEQEPVAQKSKLRAISVAPIDDPAVIQAMLATKERTFNGKYARKDDNSKAQAQVNIMTYDNSDFEGDIMKSMDILVEESFVVSERFPEFANLILSCHGDTALLMSVKCKDGTFRKFNLGDDVLVNPSQIRMYTKIFHEMTVL